MFHDHPTAAHQGSTALLQQLRKRYMWPGMSQEATDYVKTCWECQQRGNSKQNNPKITIPVEELFDRWEIDMVGPLPLTPWKNKYIIVVVDYFS